MRPGILRMKRSSAAKKPNDGPPKSSRLPSVWPSPTHTSTPSSPGGFRIPSGIGSAAHTITAPVRLPASDSAPRSSTVPRKFGCWTNTAAVSSSTAAASASRSVAPSSSSGTSTTSMPYPAAWVASAARECGWSPRLATSFVRLVSSFAR